MNRPVLNYDFDETDTTDRRNPLHREPSPITQSMIISALQKQIPTADEEGGDYAQELRIDLTKAETLALEFLSIAEIENISHLVRLTRLSLCNNVIGKIENLDGLVNLVELDFSYNNIKKIENLDNLKKLKFINFHRNFITKIENMDYQIRLETFICSTNGIETLETIKYLRRFTRLRGVCLDGNPMSTDPNYKDFIYAVIPDIIILDYVRVPTGEKEAGKEKYKTRIEKLVAIEEKARRKVEDVDAEEEGKEVQKLAFVDGFEGDVLFDALYENDADGKIILSIPDAEDTKLTYQEMFRTASESLFQKAMDAYNLRKNEYDAYNVVIKEIKDEMVTHCRSLTEEFCDYDMGVVREMKFHAFQMEDYEERFETTDKRKLPKEYSEHRKTLYTMSLEYIGNLHKLWYVLMTYELQVGEDITECSQLLERSVRELVTEWMEQLRGCFGEIRDVQLQYNDKLNETLVTYGEYRRSDTRIPDNLRELLIDKEALGAVLQASHEHHSSIIDQKEEQMVYKLRVWIEHAMTKLRNDEVSRSRKRITEISHFVDSHIDYLYDKDILPHVDKYLPDVRGEQDIPSDQEESEDEAGEVLEVAADADDDDDDFDLLGDDNDDGEIEVEVEGGEDEEQEEKIPDAPVGSVKAIGSTKSAVNNLIQAKPSDNSTNKKL